MVKADICSYGNSIDAERLIEILQESFADRDPKAVSFFIWLLRRKVFISDGVLTEGDTSALPGIPIHNFFTNIYLADTDRRLAPRCEFYARYSDDIIMFQRSREDAESNMGLLLDEFTAHRLMPHQDDKTGIYDPGQPYDYLGFSLFSISLRKLSLRYASSLSLVLSLAISLSGS